MSRLKQQWRSLSTESKVGGVLMPLVLALFAGLVLPAIKDALSHETTPERRATVKVLDVERNVPLSDFVAAHDGAKTPPMGMVLAAYQEPDATEDASDDVDQGGADPGESTGGEETGGGAKPPPADESDREQSEDLGRNGGQDRTGDPQTTGDQNTDSDGDGVRNADDICPDTPGEPTTGCVVKQLRVEPFGCTEQQMADTLGRDGRGTERCDELNAVVGDAAGSKPGDVAERAKALAAALEETRSTASRGHGGRREPIGVVVSVEATVTGFVGKHVSVTWSLRQASGRRLPHKWLKNRPVLKLTGQATSDTGSADFWVPLPKRPHGPFVVRLTMKDDDGTALTFAKTGHIA